MSQNQEPEEEFADLDELEAWMQAIKGPCRHPNTKDEPKMHPEHERVFFAADGSAVFKDGSPAVGVSVDPWAVAHAANAVPGGGGYAFNVTDLAARYDQTFNADGSRCLPGLGIGGSIPAVQVSPPPVRGQAELSRSAPNPEPVAPTDAPPAAPALGGQKHDSGKPRMSLIPRAALEAEARVLTFGAKKYSADNWRDGFEYRRLIDAAMRHLVAFSDGEDVDPETGESHLAHVRCCTAFLLDQIEHGTGVDDRYKRAPKGTR